MTSFVTYIIMKCDECTTTCNDLEVKGECTHRTHSQTQIVEYRDQSCYVSNKDKCLFEILDGKVIDDVNRFLLHDESLHSILEYAS